jgi:hypothetical protein
MILPFCSGDLCLESEWKLAAMIVFKGVSIWQLLKIRKSRFRAALAILAEIHHYLLFLSQSSSYRVRVPNIGSIPNFALFS